MTTTSEQIKSIQDRQAETRDRVVEATMALGLTADSKLIAAAMSELAQCWREDADTIEKAGRRGAKSTAAELRQAAGRLAGFAVGLTTHEWSGDRLIAPSERYRESLRALGPNNITRAVYENATNTSPMLPGEWGYIEAEHGRPSAPCFECIPAGEDPRPWCDCGDDETCKGPCRQRAHAPSFHPKTAVSTDSVMDYLTGKTDTYTPAPRTEQILAELKVDNPFTSPADPGSFAAHNPVAVIPFETLDAVATKTTAIQARDHVSHSYVSSYASCSLSAMLSDASRNGVIGPRRPSWSLIGGRAFHAAVETVERMVLEESDSTFVALDIEGFWQTHLDVEMKNAFAEVAGSPYAEASTWHVANGGREGFDWWRVEGAAMLKRYLDHHNEAWRARRKLLMIGDKPVLEYPYTMTVRTPDGLGSTTAQGFIDAAWVDLEAGAITVTDLKSGRNAPTETFQLGEYAHALAMEMTITSNGNRPGVIGAQYWLARKGIYTTNIDALKAHPLAELQYRYAQTMKGTRAGVFAPNVTNLCVSCSVRGYCPAVSSS